MDAFTTTEINQENTSSHVELNAYELNNWSHGMANVNFRHQFLNGDQLTVDYDYLHYFDNNPTDYTENTFDENNQLTSSRTFRSEKTTPVDFQVAKIDYSKKITLETRIQV